MYFSIIQFFTQDGIIIGRQGKESLPCLPDNKVRLAAIMRKAGDQVGCLHYSPLQ